MSISLIGAHHPASTEYVLDVGLYPDNTPVVNFETACNYEYGQFRAIVVRPHNLQELVTALMVVESIRDRGGKVDDLVLPYVPGARQDNKKREGDRLLTLLYVTKLIIQTGFRRVLVLDPHSLATTALLDNCVVTTFGPMFDEPEWDGVIAPDLGAVARATDFAVQYELPVYNGLKHRDPATNKLSGFSVSGLQRGKHYIVVDDICDGGGTFLGLAEKIKEAGSTADLFVTHGLFSKGTDALRKAYRKIYATDSITTLHEGVTYIKVTRRMVDYV
jgi:ribose-phosphate pyrophosphokinase